MKKADNLRGWDVLVDFDGEPCLVTIITHLRGPLWLVDGCTLPARFEIHRGCRRTTVHEDQMTFVGLPQ
jgi:hypothetical protein